MKALSLARDTGVLKLSCRVFLAMVRKNSFRYLTITLKNSWMKSTMLSQKKIKLRNKPLLKAKKRRI